MSTWRNGKGNTCISWVLNAVVVIKVSLISVQAVFFSSAVLGKVVELPAIKSCIFFIKKNIFHTEKNNQSKCYVLVAHKHSDARFKRQCLSFDTQTLVNKIIRKAINFLIKKNIYNLSRTYWWTDLLSFHTNSNLSHIWKNELFVCTYIYSKGWQDWKRKDEQILSYVQCMKEHCTFYASARRYTK